MYSWMFALALKLQLASVKSMSDLSASSDVY